MKYKKIPQPVRVAAPNPSADVAATLLLGMLYLVDVRLVRSDTGEKHKHRLLLVGCEHADIERKLRWIFDSTEYKEMSISAIEKVREKVHFISTVVTQPDAPVEPVINRETRSQIVAQQRTAVEEYDPHLYAIGISTTMIGKDEHHALRKLGHALIAQATEGRSHSGAALSADSTLTIEQVPFASGYARPRDVSNEINRAHFVAG